MAATAPRDFNTLTKTLELQAKIARDFNELNAHDYRAARFLVAQLATLVGAAIDSGTKNGTAGAGGKRESPSLDKIVAAFVKNGNTPVTKPVLAELAGVTAGGIHTSLYGTAPEMFRFKQNPAGGRHKVVQMTEEAFKQAKAAAST